MIIDGHAHACGSCNGVEAVGEYLKKQGIDKVVLCGGESNSAKDYVYFDLSAPQLYSLRILKNALNTYGANRLTLGSDTPYGKNNIQLNIDRLRKLNLSDKDIKAITGGNIVELLKLQ